MDLKTKYVFVFSLGKLNAFNIDLLIKGYKVWPCLIIVEEDSCALYFPTKLFVRLAEEGYERCFDNSFLPKFKKQVTERTQSFVTPKEKTLNKEKFKNALDNFVFWIAKYYNLYRLTESFNFTKLEKELIDWAKHQHSEPHKLVSRLLSQNYKAKLPKQIKKIVDFIKEIQRIKWDMRSVFNRAFLGRNSTYEILKRNFERITGRNDFECLTISEVKGVILGKSVPNRSERIRALAVYKERGTWKFAEDIFARKIITQIKRNIPKITEVTGTIASHGKACGIACVYEITLLHNFGNMRKGDILIASTTGPEFMVGIQKAGAVVTDEGGLMSHAAVVSRELKIPCIVGTKIATKIFKDGDLIEVDAEKGIVRKLK